MNYRPYTREDLIRIFGTYMGNMVHNQALLRELYAQKEQTEEQKEDARERARKQREAIKADPEKLAKP